MVLLTALKLMVKSVLYVGIFCLAMMCIPGLQPCGKIPEINLAPAIKLDGKLTPSNVLDKAEIIVSGRVEGVDVDGPESVAIFQDESIYSGLECGSIIKYKNGQTSVLSMGEDCEPWEPQICGRPLGIREHTGATGQQLLVADAFHGIYSVDVETGDRELLFPYKSPINGKVPRFADDLDITKDGIIYWSDASTNSTITDMIGEVLGTPSGRLIRFDPKTKKNTVVIDGIHFANGVQLSKNQDFVLVVESMQARILRYYIKGPKAGQSDVFVDRLPGIPDNIRSNGKDGFYVAIINDRDLLDQFGPWPSIRKIFLRTRHLVLSAVSLLEYFAPENRNVQELKLYIIKMPFLIQEKKALILEVDANGNIVRALQNKESKMKDISQMTVSKKYAYLSTPFGKELWRIKLSDLNN